MMRKKKVRQLIYLILSLMLTELFLSHESMAFRPFETEDAGVVENGKIELEVGFGIEQEQRGGDEVGINAPSFSVTFGLPFDIEFSIDTAGEYIDEEQEDGFKSTTEQFTDTGLNLKKLWYPGKGLFPAIATQTSLIFPVEKRSRGVDIQHMFITTWDFKSIQFNLTVGGATEHIDEKGEEKDVRGRFFYGGIVDYPFPVYKKLHLLTEYFADKVINEPLEHQLLFGLSWDGPWNIRFDTAAYWGMNHQSIDRGVTTGMTIEW